MNDIVYWEIKVLNEITLRTLYIESINYDNNLVISLKTDNFAITITFERFVSYRVSDESYLLEYWESLSNNSKDFTFSKIENSSFLKEISFLSKNFFTDGGPDLIEHYAIFTLNECVEIISDLKPIVVLKRLKN